MEPILRSAPANGGGRVGSEYGVEAYNLYLAIERIRELGVLLKDLDSGLLDFPHERDGRVVFLCWHPPEEQIGDRKSTRLNSSHANISYAVFCLKKKK